MSNDSQSKASRSWNKATLCHTANGGKGNKTFKEVVLDNDIAHQACINLQEVLGNYELYYYVCQHVATQ